MFFHIYVYRLKCIIKTKEMMFWTSAFPIILATLFYLTLSNVSSTEQFSSIKIAVVETEGLKEDSVFQTVFSSASQSLFTITYTTKETAEKLLADNKIIGYILYEEEIKLIIKQNGIGQTILKEFLDNYKQSAATVMQILSSQPADMNSLISDIMNTKDYLASVPVNKLVTNPYINSYYTLIAMLCLYGGFLGLREVIAVSADLSPEGARVNTAPIHRLKVFLYSMAAAITIQLFQVLLLMIYLTGVLHVDFGNQLGYIALTCVAGTFAGASFGTMLGVLVKGSEGKKTGILIAATMAMCFLSGMMIVEIKYAISTGFPILAKLNPVTLMSDCFYSLYFYKDHVLFFENIAILCILSVLFSSIVYLKVRREKYETI